MKIEDESLCIEVLLGSRVFFLIFGFNKGTIQQKGQKDTTQEPSL